VKDAASYTIDLVNDQRRFLDEMAAKYGLPDVGKAVRCLVNHARENPDQHEAIFGEVRCLDC
jgi:hypothetical protein